MFTRQNVGLRKGLIAVLLSLVMVVSFIPLVSAQEAMERELLLFQEIPTVITASKREQPISETASGVMVVTAEDIKQSGATSIADVLRQVAGIDVIEPTAAGHQVGIRGFPDAKHVLVNLDGNNIFIYHSNLIFWDSIPISLEEIDRIEIIKGPGAVFHGGNAFSGVINIITKTPEQLRGTQVNLVGGEKDTTLGSIIHAGSYEDWEYSINAGHREAKRWEGGLKDAETDYFGGKLIYNLDDESSFTLMGRYGDTDRLFLYGLAVGDSIYYPDNRYLGLRYDRPDFWARLFWNRHSKSSFLASGGLPTGVATIFDDDSYEAELMRTFRWDKNTTSVGGYVKRSELKTTVEGTSEDKCHTEQWAINAENEYRATDQLLLVLGGRFEHHSVVKELYMGRGSVIYTPVKNHTLRLTAASGYYIPCLLDMVADFTGSPLLGGLRGKGMSDPKVEDIYSWELAYYGLLTDRVKVNADLFYNKIKNIIYFAGLVDMANFTASSVNGPDAEQWGGELGLDFLLTNCLTAFANYAYDHIHRGDWDDLEVHPRHKFNCGLRGRFKNGISANLVLHYVDKRYLVESVGSPLTTSVKVGAYTTVDARLAYSPKDNVEFALAAYNLFNDRHIEGVGSDKIGRRITASVSYKF